MTFRPDRMAFPDGTSPEEQRDAIRSSALIAEGMCPNNCEPLVWDTEHQAHCPACPFVYEIRSWAVG